MYSETKKQAAASPPKNKREMIFWEGGVKFGVPMQLLTIAFELIKNSDHYRPSKSLAAVVFISWFWILVVYPLIFFGAGCLMGLFMWHMRGFMNKRYGKR